MGLWAFLVWGMDRRIRPIWGCDLAVLGLFGGSCSCCSSYIGVQEVFISHLYGNYREKFYNISESLLLLVATILKWTKKYTRLL